VPPPRITDRHGVALVAHAGDVFRNTPVTASELDLVATLGNLEREMLDDRWAALELVLAHVDDGRIIFPSDVDAQYALIEAVTLLGGSWHSAGRESGANTGEDGTPA
jgi:hypothetical protein